MFKQATSFDKNLGGWDVTNVTDMTEMFSGVTLSTANYDSLLIGWAAQNVQDMWFSMPETAFILLQD